MGIGIDIESTKKINLNVESLVCNDRESKLINSVCKDFPKTSGSHSDQRRMILATIFSFKESVYKCLFPIGRIRFYFPDFEITNLDPDSNKIKGRLLKKISPQHSAGDYIEGNFRLLSIDQEPFVLSVCQEFYS